MASQMKISTFFNTSGTKRRASDVDERSDSPQNKSSKIANGSSPESNAKRPLTNLSPEQRERMEANRKQAEKRLLASKSPQSFGASWKKALAAEFSKEYFVKLTSFVKEERLKKTVYPPEKDVYSWTLQCDIHEVSTNHMQHPDYTLLDKIISLECGMIYQRRSDPPLCIADFKKLRAFLQIKVVIIGQDPYHGPRQAHGLCFSVPPGVGIPPSLVNIYKELENDIDGFQAPKHGYLTGWAKQGVLLLNACLTVVASKANSHKDKGWEQFTDAVIRWINSNLTGVVFLLWGAYAQKKGSFIDKKKHCVLKAVHPSPLSAHRGFLGCKHFSQANQYLKKVGKKAIDWRSLPVDQNENFSA